MTMVTSRTRFQKKIEQRLGCWGKRRGTIASKVERAADDDEKAVLCAELAKLRALEAEGRRCLSVVETAGAAAWTRLQNDFIERWERADRAAEAIWSRVS